MGLATRAREWLAAQDGPRTSREIAQAIDAETIKVQWAVGVMLRDGLLRRVRATRPHTYIVERNADTMAERNRKAREARLARRESRKPEIEAAKAARAAARKAEQARASAARKRQRDEARRKYDRARYEARTGAVRRHAVLLESQPEPKPAIRAQTVEEWLAQGGQVERLSTAWGR